ncbi:MAG: IS256 family transposase [Deltaproteobacteria bacterium]|nr:IS256 family transposase [Deltaproteobacteria bacterium]
MAIRKDLLDELLKDYKNPEDLIGDSGILKQLTKALLERALEGEMTHHLGYEKHCPSGRNTGNSRNGKNMKKITTDHVPLEIKVPRDRISSFEPKIIPKHKKRFDGFDDKIISMYARGMTVREIQGHLEEIYGVEVSPDLISTVTASVIDEVKTWQNRPLEPVYPVIFLDALRVKIRDNGHIYNKAVYVALGINMDGMKEVLGLWIAKNEGAKFWLQVITELNNRGLKDIFIACVDGLKGFPDAIGSVFPNTQVQLCIVHMIRHSVKYVSFKDQKQVCADLKRIYRATNADQAEQELDVFAKKWDDKYPTISQSWRRNWQGIIPFMAYPENIRKVIYTTNAIESLHHSLRKIIKNRGSFPNDESALKLLYLGLKNISKRWTMPIRVWKQALNQFAILFADRFAFDELL